MKKNKGKNSQQLVEFLLIAPFMVIILGMLTEFAYALNINMTLTQGLKSATSSIYGKIKPSMTSAEITNEVKTELIEYLDENNAPTNAENNIVVGQTVVGSTCIFMASYTYIPAFTLPNIYFRIMPEKFNFFATSAVPAAFLRANTYGAWSSDDLDKIWSSSADFSTDDSFNASKKGILKNTTGRTNVLFLVRNNVDSRYNTMYALVLWDGTILRSSGSSLNVNLDNGLMYTCGTSCNSTGSRLFPYVRTNGYRNIIVVNDTSADLNDMSLDWIVPNGSVDLSTNATGGIVKRMIALVNQAYTTIGNYDYEMTSIGPETPAPSGGPSTYPPGNTSIYPPGNTPVYPPPSYTYPQDNYKIDSFGSMIFVHPINKSISAITTGQTPQNYSYNFGAK